jgi:hypothetical protein
VADFDKVIPPGQEGKVNIKIDGKKLFAGMFEKGFAVETNDPNNKSFSLTVQGTVKKALEFSREMRWAGFVDEDLKMETIITNALPEPVNITGARWGDEARAKDYDEKIGLKLETIEKGKKYRLKIWRKKELAPDNFVTNVVLTTDYPKLREKNVPLSITIMKDVELHPDKLYYGEMVIPAGATKTFDKTFNIVAARGDSLKILKAVPNRDDITVKIQEVQPGKSYRGTVWVRPSSRLGQYTGSIKLYTNIPKFKEIVLDIVGSVRVGEASATRPEVKVIDENARPPAKGKK